MSIILMTFSCPIVQSRCNYIGMCTLQPTRGSPLIEGPLGTIGKQAGQYKSNYFCTILNLLRLLSCMSIIIVVFTIQLLSIVTEKRRGRKRAKNRRTGITLRIEETSPLRVTLFQEKLPNTRIIYHFRILLFSKCFFYQKSLLTLLELCNYRHCSITCPFRKISSLEVMALFPIHFFL